jgi:hypothetical protein
VAYLASRAWYLNSRIAGEVVTSTITPYSEQDWTRPDGSGLIVRRWDNGREDRVTVQGVEQYDVRNLPTDPQALHAVLAKSNTLDQGPAGYVQALKDVWLREAPAPKAQAGLLELLAAQPGIYLRGEVTDRLGRRGVAVSADSAEGLPRRYTLIFDLRDGRLLGYEEELTTNPGKLNVRVPAVIGYQAWSEIGWVGEVGSAAKA